MEAEKIWTLANLQGIDLVSWDAMGQHILIQANTDKGQTCHLAMTPPAALSLMLLLSRLFDEREGEEETRQ